MDDIASWALHHQIRLIELDTVETSALVELVAMMIRLPSPPTTALHRQDQTGYLDL